MAHFQLTSREDLPFRDPARYLLVPWKTGEDSATRFAHAALAEARPGDSILVDGTAAPCLLWVQRFEGAGLDVRILPFWEGGKWKKITSESLPAGNPRVFVITKEKNYLPRWLRQSSHLERADASGILYHVCWGEPDSTCSP